MRRCWQLDCAVPDLAEVAGQPTGRLAMELAAAGGHHVLMLGPPGAGKTMLAERLPGLLAPLSDEQALEVTAVHSLAGALSNEAPLVRRPPFRSPHHSASLAALVGGGSRYLRPGAVSLAHRGVLFLDEAPEFGPRALDALRQPLESGFVELARATGVAKFPARFTLVLAANPCPCGKAGTPRGDAACTCAPRMRVAYRNRLSGPLMDRVDVRVRLEPPTRQNLRATLADTESTVVVAARVQRARAAAGARLAGTPWRTIGDVPGPQLRARWGLPSAITQAPDRQFERGQLTARGLDRVLRTAWTLADLAGDRLPGRVACRSGTAPAADRWWMVSRTVGLNVPHGDDRMARAALVRVSEPGDPLLARQIATMGAPRGVVAAAVRATRTSIRSASSESPGSRACACCAPATRSGPSASTTSTVLAQPRSWRRRSRCGCGDRCTWPIRSGAPLVWSVRVPRPPTGCTWAASWASSSPSSSGLWSPELPMESMPQRIGVHWPQQGPTVAVLAGGADVAYPRSHDALLARIAAEGLIVSEAPPGGLPLRRRFLVRNRLIAALSSGTVVVEAGVRSGALSTARHARRLGRPILAVPGPVTSGLSAGCHLVLRQWPESTLVTNADEVIEAVGPIGALAAASHCRRRTA